MYIIVRKTNNDVLHYESDTIENALEDIAYMIDNHGDSPQLGDFKLYKADLISLSAYTERTERTIVKQFLIK